LTDVSEVLTASLMIEAAPLKRQAIPTQRNIPEEIHLHVDFFKFPCIYNTVLI
jgi:hypothetical protein